MFYVKQFLAAMAQVEHRIATPNSECQSKQLAAKRSALFLVRHERYTAVRSYSSAAGIASSTL